MAYPTKQKDEIGIEETHLQPQLSYWKQQLAGAPPVLELPSDRPRPPVQTFCSARRSQELPQTLTESLKLLSQKEGVTLFMTLLTAFKTLLYRYTGQEDILVGSPITNRNSNKTEEPSSFKANTLVLRTQLQGNLSFSELLARVREMVREAYAHQDLPFEKLVEELQPERSLSYFPLFQVMFALQNAQLEKQELQSLTITPLQQENLTSKFDLALSIEETDQGLLGSWGYSTNLFDASTIYRMAGHFQTLLEGIVAHPELPISELPLLTKAERHQQLVKWNDTQTEYPQDKCIHQLFEEQVELTPDAVALVYQNEQLTYRELNTRANQLAHHLQSLGVGPEVLVGICVERSLEMVVGLLGILKAGGAYVPLDPTYPQERLAYMLSDSLLSVLLTQEKLAADLPEHKARVVCLDSQWEVISRESQENPVSSVQASNLAYVIYTSGSTGKPKGVLVPHKGLLNLVFWHQHAFEITPLDRATQLAGTAFDASVWELWPYLATGASIYLVKPELLNSPMHLRDWLVSQEITITFVPTPLAERLLLLEWSQSSALRILLTGGDQLHQYPSASIPFKVINNYGPTENTVVTTSTHIVFNGKGNTSPPIGRPIANTQVYILDRHLQPVPIGVPGELYIDGAGLAKGYLNRPELTQEKFIPNPFSQQEGARLYKTGDLARYLPDGNIEFLGRIDHQVKIRGFRIELGEIEAALSQHPEVGEAVVIAREDQTGDKRLVAYVVPNREPDAMKSELRRFLKQLLPNYMIPSAFVMLNALPLTPNGKVDRKALPAPPRTRPELEETFVAPCTPVEEMLAGIWVEVLGLEQIGVHDNFFHLGGHSLAATQLLTRVRDVFQIELPFNSIFESPTIAVLAQIIEQQRCESRLSQFPVIQPIKRNGSLPVSFGQQRVCFIQQLAPANTAYQFQATVRLIGQLDVEALQQSLSEIVRRHEIFRTTFPTVDGQPVQVIHQAQAVSLPLVDLRSLPKHERSTKAQQLIEIEFQKPFNVTQLPLVRWVLLRLNDDEHMLIQVEHHLVHDGWSFNVFLGELVELYKSFSIGNPSPLPELPIQFVDFAHWQRQWMQSEEAQNQLTYWKKKLAQSPPLLELPSDRPRRAVPSYQGAALRVELPISLCESLRAISRQKGVTLFMTMLSAFVTILHRYTQLDDISVGSGIANRRLQQTEGLIGMIVNNLVLRNDLSGNPTFEELLGRVRSVTLEAYAHQDLPFEKVVETLQPTRDLSYNPLYQVMFSFHDSPLSDLELPGLNLSLVEGLSNGSAKFDLNLIVIPRSEQSVGASTGTGAKGITVVWEYSTDLFDASTIARMEGHYRTLLEAIVTNPEQRLSELPMLTASEKHQLLVEWNNTQVEYPQDKCIHQLFEAQVEKTPDAVAVVFEDEQLTYRELNARANQLAHHLQVLGVGPEMLVGICVERSLEMVVGLLGILKAGGAYVPLDPNYPQERLNFMLSDSLLPVLLTQQRLVKQLPEHQSQVICLDTDWATISQQSQDNLKSKVKADNLAYLIYTSGSTGLPKGVCVIHRGVVRLVKGSDYVNWNCEKVFLQLAPISFDASTFEIWGCLLNGARLVVMPAHTPSMEELGRIIKQHQVTTLWLTAGLFHLMVDERLEDLKSVRQLLAGGDVLSVPHVQKVLQELRDCELINGYGPTENTTFTCCYPIIKSTQLGNSVPIGRPIANTQVYILDNHLQPAPIGVPGELYISGDGLARGYLNRPELNAEKFIPNPFSHEPEARLYKTGDLVRYLPNGNIEFLGRLDNQVKIRGFRIELGEIESALAQHPTVQQTVVTVREDIPGDKRLVAYIVPHQDLVPTIEELRRFLKQKLPDYMVPNAFVMLFVLPLTSNGKVNYRALPAPDQLQPDLAKTFELPRTPVEQRLAEIWSEVLKVKVGIYDNFFELGGHSLLVTQVISRVRQAFFVEVPLHKLFEFPTVAELAEYFETLLWAGLAPQALPLTTGDIREEGEL